MALTVNKQNLTTTAVALGTPRTQRKALIVRNPTGSGASVYVGNSAVAADTALYVIAAGDPTLIIANGDHDSLGSEEWYARSDAGTATGVIVGEIN